MIILKENVSLRRKPKVTIDEEAKRIADLMVGALNEDQQKVEEVPEGSIIIEETFRVPGTEEILEKGTVISITE